MKTHFLRRVSCMILALALLFSLSVSPVSAFQCSGWAEDELQEAQQAGLLPDSLEDANFTLNLTRQEMCDIAVHTFQNITGKTFYPARSDHFTDTTNSNVCIAYELGIVSGYTDGTFRPNQQITRQEMMVLFSGFFRSLGWDDAAPVLEQFSDRAQVGSWARESAATVVSLGIVAGNTNGTLTPTATGSREQTLALMLRTYNYLVEELGITPAKSEPTAQKSAAEAQVPTASDAEQTAQSDTTVPVEPGTTEPDTTEAADPGAAEAAAPDTAEAVEPGTAEAAAPDTAEAIEPGTVEAVEPDTAEAADPGTAPALDSAAEAVGAGQEATPETAPAAEPATQTKAPETKTPDYICSPWAEAQMSELVQAGLLPESLQNADLRQEISRQEICQAAVLLYTRITGNTAEAAQSGHFTDTSDPVIDAAYELGIVSGFTDGTFRPNEPLTRQQLFVIQHGLLKLLGWQASDNRAYVNSTFTDASSIGNWAVDSVARMHRLNLLAGNTNGTMAPQDNTSREEAVALFLRAYNYISPWYENNPLRVITGPVEANSKAQAVVKLALSFVGYPYRYGQASPETGFDCSGFTWYIYKQFGYNLNRTAARQIYDGINVERAQLQPGDIIIMSVAGDITRVGHVAIYIGDGQMVHAQSTATGVCITPVSSYNARYITARRIIY